MHRAQQTIFFEDAMFIDIYQNTKERLELECITTIEDLVDFDKEMTDHISSNLCCAMTVFFVALQPPFRFGSKVQRPLTKACKLIRFYETIGQPLTLTALRYTVLKHFTQ